jgi:hypothetical protein
MAIDVDERWRHRYPRVRVEQQQQVARGGRLSSKGDWPSQRQGWGQGTPRVSALIRLADAILQLLRVALMFPEVTRSILDERIQNRLAPFQSALAQRRR